MPGNYALGVMCTVMHILALH